MAAVADFPMVLPKGTKLPGGVMVPVRFRLLSFTSYVEIRTESTKHTDGVANTGAG